MQNSPRLRLTQTFLRRWRPKRSGLALRIHRLTLFYNLIGSAYLVRNDWEFNDKSADAYAKASSYSNASEAILVNAAFASVQVGREKDAVHYLEMLRRKNPNVSAKQIRAKSRFYAWVDKFLEKNEEAYEKLVKLGLPRE